MLKKRQEWLSMFVFGDGGGGGDVWVCGVCVCGGTAWGWWTMGRSMVRMSFVWRWIVKLFGHHHAQWLKTWQHCLYVIQIHRQVLNPGGGGWLHGAAVCASHCGKVRSRYVPNPTRLLQDKVSGYILETGSSAHASLSAVALYIAICCCRKQNIYMSYICNIYVKTLKGLKEISVWIRVKNARRFICKGICLGHVPFIHVHSQSAQQMQVQFWIMIKKHWIELCTDLSSFPSQSHQVLHSDIAIMVDRVSSSNDAIRPERL